MNQRGNPKAGVCDDLTLTRPQVLGTLVRIVRVGAVHTGQMTEAMCDGLVKLSSGTQLPLERSDGIALLALPEADNLRKLLVQSHL